MIGIIAAVSANGIIGKNDAIPWSYKSDMKHFKYATTGSTVIMGRHTLCSIGKPLPNRDNIVLSKIANALGVIKPDGFKLAKSIKEAIKLADPNKDIWIIGGASVYQIGMDYADKILLTLVPDIIDERNAIRFPWINPSKFNLLSINPLDIENDLKIATYLRA